MITDHPPEELSPKARLTKQLYDTIHAYANEVFPPTQIDDYREEILRFLADSLTTFTTRGIDKFSAGQLEHGGNFFRCNFRKEQVAEQYDGFFYANGDAWATAHPEALDMEEPK